MRKKMVMLVPSSQFTFKSGKKKIIDEFKN